MTIGAPYSHQTKALSSKDKWDARYRDASEPMFGTEPSEYLRQITARSDFAPNSALFLADGDGRNSRWLAAQRCDVSAVDLSETATAKALDLDRVAETQVRRVAADLGTWSGSGRRFDAVFIIALHSSRAVRRQAIETGIRHLEPGGWFVLEGFSTAQLSRRTMGPTSQDKLYDMGETLGWAQDAIEGETMDVVEALEGSVLLAEGDRHDGTAEMIRILARRRRPAATTN